MKKTITLEDEVLNDDKQVIAKMQVVLRGDGSTPNIVTVGGMPIGYHDNGTAIIPETPQEKLDEAHQNMMAVAIKEQKALCVENGVDPDLVNILNAEKQVSDHEQ